MVNYQCSQEPFSIYLCTFHRAKDQKVGEGAYAVVYKGMCT